MAFSQNYGGQTEQKTATARVMMMIQVTLLLFYVSALVVVWLTPIHWTASSLLLSPSLAVRSECEECFFLRDCLVSVESWKCRIASDDSQDDFSKWLLGEQINLQRQNVYLHYMAKHLSGNFVFVLHWLLFPSARYEQFTWFMNEECVTIICALAARRVFSPNSTMNH